MSATSSTSQSNVLHPGNGGEEARNSMAAPIIRREGEGERRWFAGGGVFTMKATAEDTNGAFALWEDRLQHGKVTPLHYHPHEDETLIVLEGEILVYADGTEHRVGPRGVAVAPRGVPHAFMVTSETALLLVLQTPGTGEAFYRDASDPVIDEAELERPADWQRLRAAAASHPDIIQIVGPPPFEAAKA